MQETAIQEEASNYIPEITDILNRVPRQMLLIFKTNDLLRGIETMLNTRAHAHSFITMSQCCVRAVYEEERAKCKSLVCKLRLDVIAHWTLFQVKLYEWYLWVRSYTIVQKVAACKADPAAYWVFIHWSHPVLAHLCSSREWEMCQIITSLWFAVTILTWWVCLHIPIATHFACLLYYLLQNIFAFPSMHNFGVRKTCVIDFNIRK